jgi:CRP/FNR family transcriptional regulator, cyclic AMP receptor protein
MVDAAFFRKIYLFQNLEEGEILQVLNRTRLREFPAGAVIIREGEFGNSLFIMQTGKVEITKQLTLKQVTLGLGEDIPKERVLIRLKAEDGVYFGEMALLESEMQAATVTFGEMALMEGETRSATVTALTDCALLELQQQDFLELIKKNPTMGVKLLLRLCQGLSRHLRKTTQDAVKLTTALVVSLGG